MTEITAKTDDVSRLRVILAASIGSALEWYDFFLYGTAAALVFGELFFPKSDPVVGTLLAFLTFGVGFVVRPLGGILFGIMGDRFGRKPVLVATLLMIGVGTTLIGLLPTYAQIGYWAPALLVAMRVVQGLGAGAEYGGAVIFLVENAPPKHRGFWGSFAPLGVSIGNLLAAGAFALVTLLPREDLMTWGWRLPFLASFLLIMVGIYVRLKITETPVFTEAVVARGKIERNPAMEALMLAFIIELFTIMGFAALSDRIGRRPVYMFGALAGIAWAFPFFLLVGTKEWIWIAVAFIGARAVVTAAMFGPQAAYFAELFPPQRRFAGFAFARELGSLLAGGPAPFVAASLVAAFGSWWPVACYAALLAALTAFAVWCGPETYEESITVDNTADGALNAAAVPLRA